MTDTEIKDRMKARGLTQEAAAKRLGISQPGVHLLIRRKLNSKKVERRFARMIGARLQEYYAVTETEDKKAS